MQTLQAVNRNNQPGSQNHPALDTRRDAIALGGTRTGSVAGGLLVAVGLLVVDGQLVVLEAVHVALVDLVGVLTGGGFGVGAALVAVVVFLDGRAIALAEDAEGSVGTLVDLVLGGGLDGDDDSGEGSWAGGFELAGLAGGVLRLGVAAVEVKSSNLIAPPAFAHSLLAYFNSGDAVFEELPFALDALLGPHFSGISVVAVSAAPVGEDERDGC
ncbi:hypothetical protein CC86DRAFT_132414 [Ophiobolus disseminans]|uniref:Uncharacterized protein n=1 Tax=Ophiobolus disseminans TaxID=1469910 RepID=A0A6A6ZHE6_9PLEO|nr:hypothetical protein CC86DRAFT_132414 [Ophiobolus disseminans]